MLVVFVVSHVKVSWMVKCVVRNIVLTQTIDFIDIKGNLYCHDKIPCQYIGYKSCSIPEQQESLKEYCPAYCSFCNRRFF